MTTVRSPHAPGTRRIKRQRADLLVGHRLRQERRLAGLTTEDLSAFLGIGADALRRFEAGQHRLDAALLTAAVALLDIPLSFFSYEIERPMPQSANDPEAAARWVALPRPPAALARPGFAQVHPLIEVWRGTRGLLCDEVAAALRAGGVHHRTYLLRQSPRSSRLIIESCASGVAILRPCESLLMVGREFHELPDSAYGAWIAQAYAEAAQDARPRLQSVRATVRSGKSGTVHACYDRVLLPWRGRGADRLIMGISLQREVSFSP